VKKRIKTSRYRNDKIATSLREGKFTLKATSNFPFFSFPLSPPRVIKFSPGKEKKKLRLGSNADGNLRHCVYILIKRKFSNLWTIAK
jgi:hypothetical protein